MLSLISIGPGDLNYMLPAAREALRQADVIIGYKIYLDQLESILRPEQTREISQLGQEMARAERAVTLAQTGRSVAMVSSGDIGIYAMASPIFDVLRQQNWTGSEPEVVVYPGVSAIQATAARLGAPLGHDFCTISLSNLLTPWPAIERRVMAAAWGDFVVGFYNPRSKKRDWQLQRAINILLTQRTPDTPVAIARNMTRPDETVTITTLGQLDVTQVDMFTLVLIGNSQTYLLGGRMATPRGYVGEEGREKRVEGREEASLYPIALNGLAGSHVVVVGGGPVGERKTRGVLAAGGRVLLVSPEATEGLQELVSEGAIDWAQRPYEANDISGAKLAFAATNDRDVNAQIADEARGMCILCNVADAPHEGDFHSPAVLRQNGLVIGINNASKDPKRAISVRNQISDLLD